MQNILIMTCFTIFIFVMIFVMMPLSILAHELGHTLAMIRLHCNGKPVIICLGCKMIFDPKTGKYYRPTSTWIFRWPRLLLIVSPSIKAAFFGITYGQEKLNTLQRFRMILAGPLVSLGLTLVWSTGAWLGAWSLLHVASLSQASLKALWIQIARDVFCLCSIGASYNSLFFLLSILPIANRKSKVLQSQKVAVPASGTDGYQLLRLWREDMRKPSKKV